MDRKKLFCFLLLAFPAIIFAEYSVRLEETVDKNKITIGDRVHADIKVVMPENFALVAPEKAETLGEWSIKDVQTYQDTKNLTKHIKYTLTAYTTGEILIPEITVKFLDSNQKEEQIKTQPVKIIIESVLDKVKGRPALRDIAPVMPLKVPVAVYLMWFLISLAAIAGAGIWYYFYRKKIAEEIPENLPPLIPPDVVALEELEKLKNSDLLKKGKIKEFYIKLIDIIRDYLSAVYKIETRDRTTSEIYSELKRKEHEKKKLAFIREFLGEGDLVKFAKFLPDEKICWQDFEVGKNIIIDKYV